MLGSVYAHIFGAANARRDVYELSRRVYEHEDPEFDVDEWVAGAHPLDDHALEHPLVTELVGQDETGPSAALAYMEDMDEDDAGAVIRWMMAGAFKGLFETDAEFCEDRFASAIADHMELWVTSEESGFPLGVDWAEAIDWEYIAGDAVGVPEQRFYSIEADEGVYVFDVKISIGQYRE